MPYTRDEAYWQAIAQRYELEPGPINLENGYFGRMSRAVLAQYRSMWPLSIAATRCMCANVSSKGTTSRFAGNWPN